MRKMLPLDRSWKKEYDMVMLNQAAIPQPDQDHMSSVLNVAQSPGGWFMEYHPTKLRPMDSPTDGIFFAGACQGPKDIPSSVGPGLCGSLPRQPSSPFRGMGN